MSSGVTRIGIVGGGTMSEAIIRGAIRDGVVSPENIMVGEPIAARRAYLEDELGVKAYAANDAIIKGASLVVLAVKPQVLDVVLESLRGKCGDCIVLSIVAGATIATIASGLDLDVSGSAIVRVMPNTPAQIGQGISVWTASQRVSEEQSQAVELLLSALGDQVRVNHESYLDMATALSGSGPAYVFLFIEALADVGVQMGLPRSVAERLAIETVRGSATYAAQSDLHLAELRNRVTSPGGTTAAGLFALEDGGMRATVAKAVQAAYQRARELGEK